MHDIAFEIASNPNYDDYEYGLVSLVLEFCEPKSRGSAAALYADMLN